MNYLDEKRDALAAAYVLGTLHGKARQRFTRLLMQNAFIRSTLWRWEAGLNTLGGALPDQTPSAEVWYAIERRLNFAGAQPTATAVQRLPERAAPIWQWLAGLATAAALVLAVVLVNLPKPIQEAQVAMVQGEKAQALWLIALQTDGLAVTAHANLQARSDRDYQLWMLAADGRPPISLGILPKSGRAKLPRDKIFDQVQVAALAVSLEPLGGSPNGKPTEVLYTAQLMTL